MNRICISGRLTKDPEKRVTNSGKKVTSFTVAVDRPYAKGTTDFFDCVAWDAKADFVENYFKKGSVIILDGYLIIRDWEDKNGNKRKNAEIIADQISFGGKSEKAEKPVSDFPVLEDESELPF